MMSASRSTPCAKESSSVPLRILSPRGKQAGARGSSTYAASPTHRISTAQAAEKSSIRIASSGLWLPF